MWGDLLLLAILVFFVALLRIFLGLLASFLALFFLTFVSHSFLLAFSRVLNLGQFLFFNGLRRLREDFNLLKPPLYFFFPALPALPVPFPLLFCCAARNNLCTPAGISWDPGQSVHNILSA